MSQKTRPPKGAELAPICVGIVRCSTDMQEHSIEDQEAEIRTWAADNRHELVEVFRDEGISASELDRPGIRALLRFLETSPRTGTLVMWKRNRLARPADPRQGLALELQIEELGWKIHFLAGAPTSGNPLADAIMGLVEHHQGGQYLRDLSQDVMRGLVRRILDGEIPGGKVPYGFKKVITSKDGTERVIDRTMKHRKMKEERTRWIPGDEREIEAVRKIFQVYATGACGMSDLASMLNKDNLPAPDGGPWVGGSVREIIRNPMYAGRLVWNRETTSKFCKLVAGRTVLKDTKLARRKGKLPAVRPRGAYAENAKEDWIVLDNHHEPLVDKALFDKAQEVLRSRGAGKGGQRHVRLAYPLTGKMWCAQCGRPMNGIGQQIKGLSYRRYICAGRGQNKSCETYTIDAPKIEKLALLKLREKYVPKDVPKDELRRRIVRILTKRFVVGGDGLPDLAALTREWAELDKKIQTAIENMGMVAPAVAKAVGQQIEAWTQRRAEVGHEMKAAERRHLVVANVEQTADEIMQMLEGLETVTPTDPRTIQRQLFAKVVDRVEMEFKTDPPRLGGKRKRHTFIKGRLYANRLLGVAQQAGTSGEDSSGRTRTYNQVVNSHLLYH